MKYRLKDGVNFTLVNEKSIMKFNFDLSNYYDKETRMFEFPDSYIAWNLMAQVFEEFLVRLDLVEKVEEYERFI